MNVPDWKCQAILKKWREGYGLKDIARSFRLPVPRVWKIVKGV